MRKKLTSVKNHVRKHRGKYVAAATVSTGAVIVYKLTKEWDELLREQGVYDAIRNES